MLKLAKLILITCFFCSLFSCRELYEPEILEVDHEYMVVEGFVEVDGRSIIKLGRTSTVYAESSSRPVNNAIINLEGANEGNWQFHFIGDGEYELQATLQENQDYQLRIQIGDMEHYVSNWMTPLITPPIEDMYFSREEDGVYVYLDTRGNDNYFLWTAEETWEYRSWFNPLMKYDHTVLDVVPREENINLCYMQRASNQIILGSSFQGTGGAIKGVEVMRIPLRSEKLGLRYSIEVWQRPLDQQAFEFWEAIRKNTEDIGGIFSPLPSYLESNLKKVGEEDIPVIGYLSIGSGYKKRFFIEFVDILPWSVKIDDYSHCHMYTDTIQPFEYPRYFDRPDLEVGWPVVFEGELLGYNYTYTDCTDCRLRGGTTEKPDFW